MYNQSELIKALEAKLEDKNAINTSFRLVFNQLGNKEGANDLEIAKSEATEILNKLIKAEIKYIRISSLSCFW
ncbi:hypothetical protein OAC51_01220 [Flavobacteriaceae bacterium]|nr:hypothetical protein [Flavobacteriaceae bacterium]